LNSSPDLAFGTSAYDTPPPSAVIGVALRHHLLKEGDSIRNPVRFAALKTHSSMVGSRCFTDGAALPDPGSGGARASCTTRSRRARWPTGPRRGRPSTQWIAGGPAGPTTADAASRGTRQRRLLMVGRSSRSGAVDFLADLSQHIPPRGWPILSRTTAGSPAPWADSSDGASLIRPASSPRPHPGDGRPGPA